MLQPAVAPKQDHAELIAELRATLAGEVRFDDGSRALYAHDGSNYRQAPIGVVIPRDKEDVIATHAACRRYDVPVLSRGCGTSLAGQCCNVAVVMDMSKYMNRVLEVDPDRRLARVQPGAVLDDLRDAAEQYHLTFAPDPATHSHNTLGGMIGNNSCGVHSMLAGGYRTSDNIIELEILTYDGVRLRVGATDDAALERLIGTGGRQGEIYSRLKALREQYADRIRARYPDIPRRVSGFNLDELLPEKGFNPARALVGSEGTCVTVLEATVALVPSPPARSLLVLGYPDIYCAGDHMRDILPYKPVGLEGVDDGLIADMKDSGIHPGNAELLPEGGGWLLVELGGQDKQQADDQAHALMDALKQADHPPSMKLYDDARQEAHVWAIRGSGLGATAHVPGKPATWPGWEDSAVAPEKVGDYLRDLRKLFEKYGYACDLYGHFGQGCIHVRIDFDLETAAGIKRYREFAHEAADLVIGYGGSLSGEHGDGQCRAELLPKMFGEDLVQAFREFKTIWDPRWRMNPGKVVDADRLDENLRLGTGYAPAQPVTHFKFPKDHGNFAGATLRCVGVGNCRKKTGGTMCPSYMVTREEKHSTRGRAHLLFEMLQGDIVKGSWQEESVKEALDLCLSCKGCTGECPVAVDIPTYKAEFLSHYFKRRARPRSAYAFGLIDLWSRCAARLPTVVNLLARTPGTRDMAKALAGMPQARQIPQFAPQTFKQWFDDRGEHNAGKPPVILWPDTFNNHFFPDTAQAAVEVLEAAGYQVRIPPQALCCGRPLYEFGMLRRAQRLLRRTLDSLDAEIRAGIPVIGLEPACVSVFRDELTNLMPNDAQAKRLSRQTYLLGEFLVNEADYQPPTLKRKALVHGHCHHKAIMKMGAEEEMLSRLGLDYEILDSGCCGMAGSFGFEKDKFDVSIKAGELVLLPKVRHTPPETLIIADGYSCREQIAQTTQRRGLHLAQVLQMALHDESALPSAGPPEARIELKRAEARRKANARAATSAAALAAGGILLWRMTRAAKRA